MITKLYPNLNCPKCGSNRISSEDVYDIEGDYIEGEDALVEKCIGVCQDCDTHVQWDRVYKFIGFRYIGVDEDEGAN